MSWEIIGGEMRCDICYNAGDGSPIWGKTKGLALFQARANGWYIVRFRNRQLHVCPLCRLSPRKRSRDADDRGLLKEEVRQWISYQETKIKGQPA
jgi:hypothetical protein